MGVIHSKVEVDFFKVEQNLIGKKEKESFRDRHKDLYRKKGLKGWGNNGA